MYGARKGQGCRGWQGAGDDGAIDLVKEDRWRQMDQGRRRVMGEEGPGPGNF